ncbi:MAG: hypothetical protein AB8H47_12260 [Bacteroidia bacterium]
MHLDLAQASEWGDFSLVPSRERKIANAFIDHQSGLLVVNEQPADQSKLKPNEYGTIHIPNQRYIVDVEQKRILPAIEWTQRFDYQPQHTISADGLFELIQQRVHNTDTELDFIEEKLIEQKSGKVISSGNRVAFYRQASPNLYERHLENQAKERKAKAAEAQKLTLEEHYFYSLRQLKEKDVLLRYQNPEGQIYRLVYVEQHFKFQREEKKVFAGTEQINCYSFNQFATSEAAWRFMTQKPEWFLRYKPLWLGKGVRLTNNLFASKIIHVSNEICNTTQLNWEQYKAIGKWTNLIYAPEISEKEYLQICPNCSSRVSKYSRYPTYICVDCKALVTDAQGRKVSFGNTSFSGGCQGYYEGTDQKYDSNDCYIGSKRFRANEARFGGIVIELYDESRRGF